MEIKGWVYRKREHGNKIFLLLRNEKGVLQCVIEKEKKEAWEIAKQLHIESSIAVEGELKKDARAPRGIELHVEKIIPFCIGEPFPIQKDFSPDFLLDVRHLWLRSRKMTQILKARDLLFHLFRDFLRKHHFYEVHPPLITKAGCEGGSEMFELDYFGEKAYLTQSSQLYLEVLIYSLERVYCLQPSFRAEKSRTRRHLNEFWHLEIEAAFFQHDDNVKLQEEMIKHVLRRFIEEGKDILEFFNTLEEVERISKEKFARISYDEAIEILRKKGLEKEYGGDFGTEDERVITAYFGVPVFVEYYPEEIKAFYMQPYKDGKVKNNDLLFPRIGEVIGGSERIWEYDLLVKKMKKFGLPLENYSWYIDLRRYGSVPHSGFGLGIERFLAWLLNLDHVRDAIPFPRTITRVEP